MAAAGLSHPVGQCTYGRVSAPQIPGRWTSMPAPMSSCRSSVLRPGFSPGHWQVPHTTTTSSSSSSSSGSSRSSSSSSSSSSRGAPRCAPWVTHAAAAADAPGGEGSSSSNPQDLIQQTGSFASAFWRFLRPHTIRGTILGTSALVTRALLECPSAIDWALLPRALLGLLALLCGNGYIVGINQIYDVDIDAVNKPFLPVAAGDLSPFVAWVLVAGLAAGGLAITATNFGPFITSLYGFGLLLGTVYSIPPLRLKRFAVPAFMIIATVRGFLLNFGVYYATRSALQLPFVWSPSISFITCFVTMFATVIAITKDLPDIEGDKAHNISTFATRLGVQNVSLLGIGMLMLNYVGAIALAFSNPAAFNMPIMVGAHAVLATILLLRAWKLAAAGYTKEAVANFYRWIWNLFYSEYLLLPIL